MPFEQLFVLVEGQDDQRFMKAVLEPRLRAHYDFVRYYQYRRSSPKTVRAFLHSLGRMECTDYLVLTDIDRSPCVSAKRGKVENLYGPQVDLGKVIVVIAEIESWYLAGLDDDACTALGLGTFTNTDGITKERFGDMKPQRFESRIDFMIEVLQRFSIKTAQSKNRSFDYFVRQVVAG